MTNLTSASAAALPPAAPGSATPLVPFAEVSAEALTALADFLRDRRLFVLTGAGCSTASGIADYRDMAGAWKRPMPTTFQTFTQDNVMRRRYWARSMIGWRRFAHAQPNDAHRVLAEWERQHRIDLLLTQNVDGLHEAAGSRNIVDLHGKLDAVCCLACGARFHRDDMQRELEARNPEWLSLTAVSAPDGDADLESDAFDTFDVPDHADCGGMLKPDVVFFGEAVPRERVDRSLAALEKADAMLVVGSSLMVYSGYRFAVAAAARGLPIAAINIGHTRADDLLSLKLAGPAAQVLRALEDKLS